MKFKIGTQIGAVALAAVFLLGPGVSRSMACKGAGPDKHIGNVTAVDAKALTLTIRDAETSNLMTFKAEESLLAGIKESDRVMIQFKEEEGQLIAVAIQS